MKQLNDYFATKHKGVYYRIRVEDIIRIQAYGNDIRVVFYSPIHFTPSKELTGGQPLTVLLKDGQVVQILSTTTMKKMMEFLGEDDFMQPHNSHIINKKKIDKYDPNDTSLEADGGSVFMCNNDRVPVSRNKKEEVKRLFTDLFLD